MMTLWRPQQFHSNTQCHWASGSTICIPSKGQRFTSWGCTHSDNGTRFLVLALSCYIGDPDVIDQWPHPRLHAVNGKLH
jgi:hypothetical protein